MSGRQAVSGEHFLLDFGRQTKSVILKLAGQKNLFRKFFVFKNIGRLYFVLLYGRFAIS